MRVKGEDSIMRVLGKLLVIGMLPVTLFAAPVVYLNDNFNDNDRSNESLPDSGAWFQSFNNLGTIEVSTGDYALQNLPTSATVRHAVTYFAPTDSPVFLSSAGDKLTLSFDITPTSATPADAFNVLRFALLDSGSARVSGDNDNPQLVLNGGYGVFLNPADAKVNVLARSTNNAAYLASSTTGWGTSLGIQTAGTGFAMVQGTNYTMTVGITRLATDDVRIDYAVSDGSRSYSVSFVDGSYQNYSYDTFVIAWSDAFGIGTVDNVIISTDTVAVGTVITHGGDSVLMDFVPINMDLENTITDPDYASYSYPGGFGVVDYVYNMGKYEVTVAQWDAVVAADPRVAEDSPDAPNWTGFQPAAKMSWYAAAKFCNWLTSGDAYSGAYQFDGTGTLVAFDRAAAQATYGTIYVLPNQDEWVKAAYWKGTGYTVYPTGNATPISGVEENAADVYTAPWVVGSGTEEQNGTYDMAGNLVEWIESAADGTLDVMDEDRISRDTAYTFSQLSAKRMKMATTAIDSQLGTRGFRIVEVLGEAEPPVISIAVNGGNLMVSLANLTPSATNVLQFKTHLVDALWNDLYTATGVTETNWVISAEDQSFFRIEASY